MKTNRFQCRPIALISFVCFAILGLLVRAADGQFNLPPETARLKPGPGAELTTSQCLFCHSADYIGTQPPLTRSVWLAEVTKMRQKYGAPIPTNKVDAVVEYLVKNYGKEYPAPKTK
jgi:hypothetical protein